MVLNFHAINDLSNDVISNIAIYVSDILYTKCDEASDPWKQLPFASELESELCDTVDWGTKWLVDFDAGKTELVLFDQSNNTGAIDMKMGASVLEMLELIFSSKFDWGCYIISNT